MASPAVAAPQANGVTTLSRPQSPASVTTAKRKRDVDDDSGPELNGSDTDGSKPTVNGLHTVRDSKVLISDFFTTLQSFDIGSHPILKRPLLESHSDDDPSPPKKPKSEDGSAQPSIADKISQNAYNTVDELVSDVVGAAKAQLAELESASSESDDGSTDEAIAQTAAFRTKALELYRREMAYPHVPRHVAPKPDLKEAMNGGMGGLVLTTVGAAPTVRPLFTSLQRATAPGGVAKSLPEGSLPHGVTATRILPEFTATTDKNTRSLTLGELFPSPRNLPPLQPPKAPKNITKGNVLTFYHPELTEKSRYRSGTYFTQNLATGHWLDYSNATPTTHARSKQRERAQSLAGHRPSSTELEISEMEAMFRGAFSSFAPCKDDSAAIIPSGQLGRIWWQRIGRRNFEKLVDVDGPEDGNVDTTMTGTDEDVEIDEELVKSAIENWDDNLVDPSLEELLGKKSTEEKEMDDMLEEVSDLIETLASYQRNRNLTLPTSQDRYSADPVNADMLRNGNLSHQPSEEEMMTYQALKAQLSSIVQTLPPYAVARLNADKLGELNVSTKIEIRTDEYKGVMEEDEQARLARQAAATAATTNQRQQQRGSVSGPGQFAHQYPGQFTPSARPIANAQHFPQTPGRPNPPMYQQRPPSAVPIPQVLPQSQQRAPPPPASYRPPTNYGYAPQLAKAPAPYGQHNVPGGYAPSPPQPRMAPHPGPGYNMAPAGPPGQRYPPGYPGPQGYPQHQPMHPQHVQHPGPPQHPSPHMQQHPQQPGFAPPYTNGAPMPRAITPQVPPQTPHHYGPTPTPTPPPPPPGPPQQHQQMQRGPYGTPGQSMPPQNMQPNNMQRQYGAGSPPMMPAPQNMNRTPSLTGYATVMPEVQQRQVMEQARARADAEQRASGHMGKVAQGEVVGLAGIGLGGNVDVHKIAAAKAMQMGGPGGGSGQGQVTNMPPSPKLPMHGGPSPVNGVTPVPVPVPSPIPAAQQQQQPQQQQPPPQQSQVQTQQQQQQQQMMSQPQPQQQQPQLPQSGGPSPAPPAQQGFRPPSA
ncbi:hypothetical protein NEUTE1DRAFT_131378 [Neurospora tetrasperma FGSC 2508]|uniref:Uncharacterized protein n=1 Tax=Neurospora tetrasperma (strain FGSC 2508 / ATCC MYA-4615 / P0657) TaxID=510951 RepID=F8MUL3_NEUT8|nr:uncharacterized protein NEUTE1DRAFT_131378 [Neurospora tetrasperma FGSC 2508]EGO55695.1 hypothetical protein NEUTE1DRAFT_131378 [Neurospora tetrasperma FGSC 2508]EGZ69055.1 hypothetical protein NEUTE2DRAFT_93813 [Neurospora tetrasperma FGSC 2509]